MSIRWQSQRDWFENCATQKKHYKQKPQNNLRPETTCAAALWEWKSSLSRVYFVSPDRAFFQNSSIRVLHHILPWNKWWLACLNSEVMRTNVSVELTSILSNKKQVHWCHKRLIWLASSVRVGGRLHLDASFSPRPPVISCSSPLTPYSKIKPGWCHKHPSGGLQPYTE